MIKLRVPASAVVVLVGLMGSIPVAEAYSTGGRFATSETGGPFPGETNCTRCHRGTDLNAGSGTLQLLINGASAADHAYTPGETVTLIVEFLDTTVSRSGFQLTARSGTGCGQPGTLAEAAGSPSTVRVKSVQCEEQTVAIATHNRAANGPSSIWHVSWTAPAESVGPVTVAAVVNGANGDQARTGDKIYNVVATMQPAAVEAPAPTISENGVILGDRASKTTTLAPGAIAVVQGSNFSNEAAMLSGTVGDDGLVSTNIGGTCVEVNQTKAPLMRLTNEEIIFQVPFTTGLGNTSVEVVRTCGEPAARRSNRATVMTEAVKPVIFLFSDSTHGVAAIHTDGVLVGPADTVAGMTLRPALPGDVVTVFGTGFGWTEPLLVTGEIAVAPASLASESVRPMIGEMEVADTDLIYAGAAPNFAGLSQMSFKIPENTAAGSHEFSVLLNGVKSAAGPKIEIGSVAVTTPPATPEPPATDPDDTPACEVDLTLQSGESCTATIEGFGSVVFEVKEDGDACASAGALSVCHSENTLLTTLPLFRAGVLQNDDGSWTITKLP